MARFPSARSRRLAPGAAVMGATGVLVVLLLAARDRGSESTAPSRAEEFRVVTGCGRGADAVRAQPPGWTPLQRLLEGIVGPWAVECQGDGLDRSVQSDTRWFHSTPPVTAVAGRSYEYRPRVAGIEGAEWSIEGTVPPGLVIDPSTGYVSGAPSVPGTFRIHVVASGDARSVEQQYMLTVNHRSHVLGTNRGRQDLLDLVLDGLIAALLSGVIAAGVAVGAGGVAGAYAGFHGGRLSSVVHGALRWLESLPSLLVLLIVAAASEFNLIAIMVALGVLLLPETARAVGERVQAFRRREFVDAARELGETEARILWHEIIWTNLRPLLLRMVARAFALAIVAEVTLGYLNFSTEQSWGFLLAEGRRGMWEAPWQLAAPAAAIVLTLACFGIIEWGLQYREEVA